MRVIVLSCLFAQLSATAAKYHVQDLGLPTGFVLSRGTDLNNQGQAVGWVETADHVSRAFVWDRGSMHVLSRSGWVESLANSINNRGEISGAARTEVGRQAIVWRPPAVQILGEIDRFPHLGMPGNYVAGGSINDHSRVVARLTAADGNQRSALWSDGQTIFFGLLSDGRKCHALAINSRDQIVGQVFDTNSHSRPFLWHEGRFLDLGSLDGDRASATGINDAGMVIGWALPPGAKLRQAQAFVWTDAGGLRSLGTLGGRTSRAYGLNHSGQVVGYSQDQAGRFVAFLWSDGKMQDLNEWVAGSDWQIVSAHAINDHGQILATAAPGDGGQSRAVLLNPIGLKPASFASTTPVEQLDSSGSGNRFRLLALERREDGTVRLEFSDWPDVDYAIEVSVDLKTWTRLGPATRSDFRNTFIDTDADRAKLCFYRAVRLHSHQLP